jgi:hypothetical protein
MINQIIEQIEKNELRPKVWLIIYSPIQGQFTVSRSDKEGAINLRLASEGRIEEANSGFIVGYRETEADAISLIPDLVKYLELRWSEKDMKWEPLAH